jgi:hypothetical protein
MLEFPAQEAIEIYASDSGFIVFKAYTYDGCDEDVVCLTIGQFRAVIKHAEELITKAEGNRAVWKAQGNE